MPTTAVADPSSGGAGGSVFVRDAAEGKYIAIGADGCLEAVTAPAGGQLPVGSIYLAVVSTNPATLFGYGTWAAIGTGRVLVGVDPADSAIDAAEKTTGSKTVAAAGSCSVPTFTGSALGTHSHGAGTLVPSAHSGAAVAAHAAHTHSVTSNVAVADHAAGTSGANSGAAVKIGTSTASAAPSGHTHSTPALVHGVTNNAVTSGNPSASLTHAVTQPDAHTMSGSSEAVSAGTPAGTVSAPTFTGSATSVVQPSFACYIWKRTA